MHGKKYMMYVSYRVIRRGVTSIIPHFSPHPTWVRWVMTPCKCFARTTNVTWLTLLVVSLEMLNDGRKTYLFLCSSPIKVCSYSWGIVAVTSLDISENIKAVEMWSKYTVLQVACAARWVLLNLNSTAGIWFKITNSIKMMCWNNFTKKIIVFVFPRFFRENALVFVHYVRMVVCVLIRSATYRNVQIIVFAVFFHIYVPLLSHFFRTCSSSTLTTLMNVRALISPSLTPHFRGSAKPRQRKNWK